LPAGSKQPYPYPLEAAVDGAARHHGREEHSERHDGRAGAEQDEKRLGGRIEVSSRAAGLPVRASQIALNLASR
jgi:hypothetical protein